MVSARFRRGKMSKKYIKIAKKERGTTLTLEQYELFVAFLKHGIRPTRKSLKNAGFMGTLNGGHGQSEGQPKIPFARFKSIAERMSYRECDDQLIFNANSKIVLPNSMFEEVICQAHRCRGNKHLNLTRTIQKIGEKYTIGCRQFGISEEHVRMVIKKCRVGSCADKHKAEMGVLKNFANTDKGCSSKTGTCSLKEATSTETRQPHNQASVIKVPVINSIPMTVVKLPNGTFGFRPSSNFPNFPGLPPSNQVSMFHGAKILPSGPVSLPEHSNTLNYSCSATVPALTNMSDTSRMTTNTPCTSAENRVSNSFAIPIHLVKIGSQPIISGQQICLVNGGAFTNLFNTGPCQPIDLSKSSKPLDLSVTASRSEADLKNDTKQTKSKAKSCFPRNSASNSVRGPLELDQNNNVLLSSEEDGDTKRCQLQKGIGQRLRSTHTAENDLSSNVDPCSYSNSGEVIDLTESCQEKTEIFEGSDLQEDTTTRAESTGNGKDSSFILPPLPYAKIWYYYDALSKQTNPYERISMCIKDMRLDVMMSLSGSSQATERMKKKMHYIQELITSQKIFTKYYSDLYSTVCNTT